MTLNTSGPISLGGSMVGQSINLELGQAATATASINATNFRTLAGVASGQISLSNFYGKSNASYFINQVIFNDIASTYGVALDSSGNIYTASAYTGSTTGWIGKYNPSGTLQWQRSISSYFDCYGGIYTDSSGNTVMYGSDGSNSWYFIKFDTNGNTLWQTNLNMGSGATYPSAEGGIAQDSSGNYYFGGSLYASSVTQGVVIKLSSSGALQWVYTPTRFNYIPKENRGFTIDSSGNLYSWSYQGGTQNGTLISATSAGNSYNWSNTINSWPAGNFNSAKYMPNGNIFIYSSYGNFKAMIVNSSGSTVYQNGLTTTQTWRFFGGCCVDSSSNIYASFSIGPSNQYIVIVKYNSSLTLQWARSIVVSGQSLQAYAIACNSTDVVFTFRGFGTGYTLMKIPSDGSKTGTYTVGGVTYVYGVETSLSASGDTGTWTALNVNGTNNRGGTGTSGTKTISTGSNTNNFIAI